jgi:MarR family transcriptional regulator, organic hydroperoxide resistance regulator
MCPICYDKKIGEAKFMSKVEDKEYDIWILFSRVYHLIAMLRKLELSKFDILPVQSYILFIIKALGNDTTPSKISEFGYQQRSSISDILNRMEKDGLVKKTSNSGSKKRVLITLTDKGEKALALSRKREFLHKIMSSLTEEQRKQLESGLEILRDTAINELSVTQKTILRPSQISRYYRQKNLL